MRVRWDREQLIGGKPARLVSRALRVFARVSNRETLELMEGAGLNYSCGIDWAEGHHDVAIIDGGGKLVAKKHISDDPAGLSALIEMCWRRGLAPRI